MVVLGEKVQGLYTYPLNLVNLDIIFEKNLEREDKENKLKLQGMQFNKLFNN